MNKQKLLWALFLLQVFLTVFSFASIPSHNSLHLIVTYAPLFLLILHACWTLPILRGLSFIFLAAFVGFAAEAISLHYGTLFGGDYTYPAQASIFGVPLSIIAYWSIFIYMGYWLNTSFLYWAGKVKPTRKQGNLALLGLLVLADGLAVTAIDLVMDPVSVRAGSWTWVNGGPYFGVPLGNFVGWFLVTAVVTGIFRLFEYYAPKEAPKSGTSVMLIPVLGYLLVGVNFVIGALSYHLPVLACLGLVLVITPAVVNLLLYALRKDSIKHWNGIR